MVIKKVFDNVFDEEVHSDFLKFGRGEYKNRYLIEVKKQSGGKFSVKTSPEFANFFVRWCLDSLDRESVVVKGVVISTFDLKEDFESAGIDVKKTSNFQGVRKTAVDGEVSVRKMVELVDKYPRCFFALSLKTEDCDLKIKPKAPKSGKPGKNDDQPKADFCSLKTTKEGIVKDLLFDVDISNIKDCKVKHTIRVDEIVYPENMKDLKPAEIRENSKRKGIVIREIDLDGSLKKQEGKFIA